MAGMELYGIAGAVVSAFQTAADTVQAVKERKEKKRRKKEKDMEEIFEMKMLHKSLVEGANQCRTCCDDRFRRFGPAFGMGDTTATYALKDVVISLQGEVIQALQIARAVENAVLDLTRLHESSITCRKDAIRAMDAMCQRIVGNMQVQGYAPESFDSRKSSMSSATSNARYAAMQRVGSSDSADSFPTLPAGVSIPGQPNNQRSSVQRFSSMRQSGVPGHSSHASWAGSVNVRYRDTDILNFQGPSVPEDEEYEGHKPQNQNDLDDMSQLSIQDSAIGDVGSGQQTNASAHSLHSEPPRQSSTSQRSTSTQQQEAEEPPSYGSVPVPAEQPPTDKKDDDLTPDSSETASVSSRATQPTANRNESTEDASRAMYAPEVVTKEFESMLSQQPTRPSYHTKRPSHLAGVHPALRVPYNYVEAPPSPEPDSVWLPLPRPARHNNYHGFCKGAWQIRKSVNEGLSIKMIPDAEGKTIPHWSCKLCKFRSKALNQKALPDQIYFNHRSGIRYRWLFLAKSHIATNLYYNKAESYPYGCIFCAAEGRTTAVHDKLDQLMVHIVAKHKTSMMTPETKEKTKCIVGGVPDRAEEWDINLPETKPSKLGGAAGEFVVAAMTGLSKYGNPVSRTVG